MNLVNALIVIFLICLLSIYLFMKNDNNSKTERIPSPMPAKSDLSKSWSLLENFISNKDNELAPVSEDSNEEVNISTVQSDKEENYKENDILKKHMEYSKAFDNFILKKEEDLDLPLDKSNKLTEQRNTSLDRDVNSRNLQNYVRDAILKSICNLKTNEQDKVIENFEDNSVENEDDIINNLFNFVKTTGEKAYEQIKPILNNLKSTISENFDSDEILNKINNISQEVLKEEIAKLPRSKMDLITFYAKNVKNTLDKLS